MIPVVEQIKPTPLPETCMSAIEFLRYEKEFSKSLGATENEFFENAEKWKTKSEEEKQLCYMDFAERYGDYVCGYEKRHSKRK